MASQLVEFLEERKGKAQGGDWQARKEAWITSVERLHETIKHLLEPSEKKGIASIATNWIDITEDFVGTYTVPELKLTVGDDRVTFTPKGLIVYGASGRVDVRGDRDTVSLIRLPNEPSGEWQVVLRRVPKIMTVPLGERSLVDLLERVMAP